MLEAKTLNDHIAETLSTYLAQSYCRDQAEEVAALCELSRQALLAIGEQFDYQSALVVSARIQADLLDLLERQLKGEKLQF